MSKEQQKQRAIIFGAGKAGQAALKKLQARYEVIAFSDNKPLEDKVLGLEVIAPSRLKELSCDCIFIASEYFEQIQKQLIGDLGVNVNKIKVLPASMIKELSFDLNKETESLAEKILLSVCGTLNNHNIRYHLDAGTLLGIYRDGALIPWDDDLDVAVTSERVGELEVVMPLILKGLKSSTNFEWVCDKHYAQRTFGAVKKGALRSFKLRCPERSDTLPMLDIFIKYILGEQMDYVIASRGLRMPSKHMLLPLEMYKFKEQVVFFPHEPDTYLTLHYGDWRIPMRDWNLGMLKNATVFE